MDIIREAKESSHFPVSNKSLYLKQKETLDTFLSHGAISQAQYEKSLHDLSVKMGYTL